MDTKSRRQKRRDDIPSSLDAAIDAVDNAQSDSTLARLLFYSVGETLRVIKVRSPLFSHDLFQVHA